MILSFERAQEIINAFGQCTVLYECTLPQELIDDAIDQESELTLVKLLLDVESIHADRSAACNENAAIYNEWLLMRSDIIPRLNALGIAIQ